MRPELLKKLEAIEKSLGIVRNQIFTCTQKDEIAAAQASSRKGTITVVHTRASGLDNDCPVCLNGTSQNQNLEVSYGFKCR